MKKLKEKNIENYQFVLKQKVVEALIFSSSEPIPYEELLKRIIDKDILNEILENLEKNTPQAELICMLLIIHMHLEHR